MRNIFQYIKVFMFAQCTLESVWWNSLSKTAQPSIHLSLQELQIPIHTQRLCQLILTKGSLLNWPLCTWYGRVSCLTHSGRVTLIWIGNLTIIGSDNGLLPGWLQTIICTNAGILLIGPLGTNLSEILFGFQTFSVKKMHLQNVICEMASILSWPQCLKAEDVW